MKILDELKKSGTPVRKIGRDYGVDERTIRQWKYQEEKLRNFEDSPNKRRRVGSCGPKAHDSEMEERLVMWITAQREKHF